MASARNIIRWDGSDDTEALHALRALPPGEYLIVPVNHTGGWDLSPDEEADLEGALDEADRGDLVDADDVHAALRVKIDAALSKR